jgi:hypothetical protein
MVAKTLTVHVGLEKRYSFKVSQITEGGLLKSATAHTTACTSVALIVGARVRISLYSRHHVKRLAATIHRGGQVDDAALRPGMPAWRRMCDSIAEMFTDPLCKQSSCALVSAGAGVVLNMCR